MTEHLNLTCPKEVFENKHYNVFPTVIWNLGQSHLATHPANCSHFHVISYNFCEDKLLFLKFAFCTSAEKIFVSEFKHLTEEHFYENPVSGNLSDHETEYFFLMINEMPVSQKWKIKHLSTCFCGSIDFLKVLPYLQC